MNSDVDLLTTAHQKDHIATRCVFMVTTISFTDHFGCTGRAFGLVCV